LKNINLLPTWYTQDQHQRKVLRLQFMLLLALGGVMGGWLMYAQRDLITLRQQHDTLAQRASMVGDLNAQLSARRTDLAKLENLQLAYRELGHTVPMSLVVQQLQNDMTTGMALSKITVDVRSEAIKGTGNIGDAKNPAKFREIARLTVVGIAPNDTQIAQLIGKVSQNPLFSEVALNYTRTEILRDYNVRRFEIQMNMDLDRLSIDDQRPQVAAGEVHDGR